MDFAKRFITLLSGPFRTMSTTLSLSVVNCAVKPAGDSARKLLENKEMGLYFIDHDLKRLNAYSRNLVDYHLVADLVPQLAKLFFNNRFPESVSLSTLQKALLVGIGLQGKSIDDLVKEYDMGSSQLLALFNRSIRKLSTQLHMVQEKQVSEELESTEEMKAARKVQQEMQNKSHNTKEPVEKTNALQDLNLDKYAIKGNEQDWEDALKAGLTNNVSIKTGKRKGTAQKDQGDQKKKFGKRKGKHKRHKK